jgi:hypothetical protein
MAKMARQQRSDTQVPATRFRQQPGKFQAAAHQRISAEHQTPNQGIGTRGNSQLESMTRTNQANRRFESMTRIDHLNLLEDIHQNNSGLPPVQRQIRTPSLGF